MLANTNKEKYGVISNKLVKINEEIEIIIQKCGEEIEDLQKKIVPHIENFIEITNKYITDDTFYNFSKKRILNSNLKENIKDIINNIFKYSRFIDDDQALDLILRLASLNYHINFAFFDSNLLSNRINIMDFITKKEISKLMLLFSLINIETNESFLNQINLQSIWDKINKIDNFNDQELKNIFVGLEFVASIKNYNYCYNLNVNKLLQQADLNNFFIDPVHKDKFNEISLNNEKSYSIDKQAIQDLNTLNTKDKDLKIKFLNYFSRLKENKCDKNNLILLNRKKFICTINNIKDFNKYELQNFMSNLIFLSFKREELLSLNFNLHKIICKINEFVEQSKFSIQEILTLFNNLANLELRKEDLINLSLKKLIEEINTCRMYYHYNAPQLFFLLTDFLKLGYTKDDLSNFNFKELLEKSENQKHYLILNNKSNVSVIPSLVEFGYKKENLPNFNLNIIIEKINSFSYFTLDQMLNFIKNIYAFDYTKSFLKVLNLNNLITQVKMFKLHSDNYSEIFKMLAVISCLTEFGCTKNSFMGVNTTNIFIGINNMHTLNAWQLSYIINSLVKINYTKKDLLNLDLNNLIIQIKDVNNFKKENIDIIKNSLKKLNYTDDDLKELDPIQTPIVNVNPTIQFNGIMQNTMVLQTKKATNKPGEFPIQKLSDSQMNNEIMHIFNEKPRHNQVSDKLIEFFNEESSHGEFYEEPIIQFNEESNHNEFYVEPINQFNKKQIEYIIINEVFSEINKELSDNKAIKK